MIECSVIRSYLSRLRSNTVISFKYRSTCTKSQDKKTIYKDERHEYCWSAIFFHLNWLDPILMSSPSPSTKPCQNKNILNHVKDVILNKKYTYQQTWSFEIIFSLDSLTRSASSTAKAGKLITLKTEAATSC